MRHSLAGRGKSLILDLDLPSDLRKLTDPELFLREHADWLVCIDEIQMKPDLFPLLRAVVDQDRCPGRFVILGSASRDLIRQSSETLAGRIHYLELTPFRFAEIERAPGYGPEAYRRLWWRGGFPPAFLEESDAISSRWRLDLAALPAEVNCPKGRSHHPVPSHCPPSSGSLTLGDARLTLGLSGVRNRREDPMSQF